MSGERSQLFCGRQWTGRVLTASADLCPHRWGVEVAIDRPARLTAFDLVLGDLSALEALALQVWRRPQRTPSRWVSSRWNSSRWRARPKRELAPRRAATGDDLPILTRRYPVVALFDGPVPRIPVHVALPFGDVLTAQAGEVWIFEVTALVEGREAPLSVGIVDHDGRSGHNQGFHGDRPGNRQRLDADWDLAWSLYEAAPVSPPCVARPFEVTGRDGVASLRQSHRLTIPALVLNRFQDRFIAPAQEILVPPPGSHPVSQVVSPGATGETRTLFRHFSDLGATGGATVLETDDERGLVVLERAEAEGTLEYIGHDCRYDLLSLDTRTGRLELTLGQPRARDPEEYAATPPPGATPAFALYTTHRDVELIPLGPAGSLVAAGAEAAHAVWLEECRARLPNTFRKLRRGEPLTLAGYGDSITALGGREAAQNHSPDGALRDRLGYFECYGKDWKADVATFDHGDGAGPVHHRLGWNWALKQTIENRWGVDVAYRNWGVAGTTSNPDARTMDGVDYLNGSHPERLEALTASRPDLVVVAFGMNDVGDATDTRANIRRICEAIQAAGSEALVVAPCRQNLGFRSRDPALWRWTHDAVIQGAMEAGAAWCATIPIMGDGNEGVLGLSRRSHSAATLGNHPGARELKAVGRYLSLIFN